MPLGEPTGRSAVVDLRQTDDRDAAVADLELEDGRILRVNAGEASLAEDVTLTLRPDADADRYVVLISSARDVVFPRDPGPPTVDGVTLHVSPFDLPWERGEILYADAPRVTVLSVPAGEDVPVSAAGTHVETLCLAVTDAEEAAFSSFEDHYPLPGMLLEVVIRSSEAALELTCTEADPAAEPFDGMAWAAEQNGIELPPETERPFSALLPRRSHEAAEREEIEDGAQDRHLLELVSTARDELRLRVPSDSDTLRTVTAVPVWLWGPEDEVHTLEPGETLHLELPVDPALRDLAQEAAICLEAQEGDEEPVLWCVD
ncbi:hypothetical protein [Nesterenkonia sp. PF2B19]|uniref:hypothetical protein n=1 Tax=unclassified Nesterenkonia TaxID=2629769 RepID=UPI0008723170|nr:hypothetical protein [Nesterenkonia sp. PF2B19]OSM42827.1 hypothetical protein BCY76_012115 [Nesterenkonia sp. PF2B19]